MEDKNESGTRQIYQEKRESEWKNETERKERRWKMTK